MMNQTAVITFVDTQDKSASSPCCDCCQNLIIDDMKYSVFTKKMADNSMRSEFICSDCVDIEHIIRYKQNVKRLERLAIQKRATFSWKNLPNELNYKILEYIDKNTRLSLYCDKVFQCTPEIAIEYYKKRFIQIGRLCRPRWRASTMSILRNSHIILKTCVDSIKAYEAKLNEIFSLEYSANNLQILLWKCKRWFRYYNNGKIMRKKRVLYVYNSINQFVKNI
jgi:hypothetical protein